MPNFDWQALFNESQPESGATLDQLRRLQQAIGAPLPPSYIDFLGWSNGGFFLNGDRELNVLACDEIEEYAQLYQLPKTMPGAIPFALNGRGFFYLFDARKPPGPDGEYPILFADGEEPSFERAAPAAASLVELCRGTTDLENQLRAS